MTEMERLYVYEEHVSSLYVVKQKEKRATKVKEIKLDSY